MIFAALIFFSVSFLQAGDNETPVSPTTPKTPTSPSISTPLDANDMFGQVKVENEKNLCTITLNANRTIAYLILRSLENLKEVAPGALTATIMLWKSGDGTEPSEKSVTKLKKTLPKGWSEVSFDEKTGILKAQRETKTPSTPKTSKNFQKTSKKSDVKNQLQKSLF